MVNPSSMPPAPAPWPQAGAPRPKRRWSTVAWLVALTLVGGVALVGWLRPAQDHKPTGSPTYTDQQVANAKSNICTAFEKVQRGLSFAHSHVDSNGYTPDAGGAALTQVALDAGSRYLLTKLAEEPATPTDLATAVRNEANAEQEALIGYMAGLTVSAPELQSTLNASNEATATVRQLCK